MLEPADEGESTRHETTPPPQDGNLLIEDIRIGDGAVCLVDSQVIVRYRGTLEDGTVIAATEPDESRGPWPLDRLMAGWRQGLVNMKVGGERRLVIPPELAYGDKPVTDPETGENLIPAAATLIYYIELIDVH